MRTFAELEDRYRHTLARATFADRSATGSLEVNGEDTLLRLSSEQVLPLFGDESGWFQLPLHLSDGSSALLHNALEVHSTTYTGSSDAPWPENQRTDIFPNLILFGADALAPDQLVSAISFRLKGLDHFFHYRQIEHHSTYGANEEQLQLLKSFRREGAPYDLFQPSDVYVQHRLPRLLKIDAGDAFYEVHSSGRRIGPGWGKIDVTTWPTAVIRFKSLVTIEAALDRAFAWHWYFQQMVFAPMPFEGIALQRERLMPPRTCEVYAPMMAMRDLAKVGRDLQPWAVPLNGWSDRGESRRLMQGWLERQQRRDTFRALLNGVIEHMARRTSLDDIVRLCAAIESLDELATDGPITSEMITPVTAAAVKKAKDLSLPIGADRISGLLGSLSRPSLSHRLQQMLAKLPEIVDRDQANLITRTAIRLRQTGAHAARYPELRSPLVGPTTSGLASLCALFDLTTCGLSADAIVSRQCQPLTHFHEAASRLTELEASRTSELR